MDIHIGNRLVMHLIFWRPAAIYKPMIDTSHPGRAEVWPGKHSSWTGEYEANRLE